jgi:hypothetical protein
MQVVEKNIGEKVEYTVDDNRLFLRGELILDLAKYERDFPVHIDICENEFGMLTMGISRKYVAQIDIPAREYDYITDGADPVPFDMKRVTLTLWAIEGGNA